MFALIETENGVRPAILEATGQYRGAPVGGKPTSEKKDRGRKKKIGVTPAICDSYRSFSLNRDHTDSSSVDHSLNLRRYRFGGTRNDVLIAADS